MKNSGSTFVRAVQQILYPIRKFAKSYVDDMAVHSDTFSEHIKHVRMYLTEIRKSGLALNLSKCEFGKSEVKYLWHIIGSDRHRPDPSRTEAVIKITPPIIKKQIRRFVGMFNPLTAKQNFSKLSFRAK